MKQLQSASALKDALTQGQRIAGLDVGDATIGMALSDRSLTIATPYHTIARGKLTKDVAALKQMITAEHVGALVIGWPVNMNGTEGPRCQSTRQFLRNIEREGILLPVLLWDERLSTVAVTRTLLEADMSRRKRGQVVDKMAAAYILQGALDAIRL